MTSPEDEFDDAVQDLLNLDAEEIGIFRGAILDLNYEVLYKQIWKNQEEFARITKRNYLIVIVLLSISIVLNLIREFRWW